MTSDLKRAYARAEHETAALDGFVRKRTLAGHVARGLVLLAWGVAVVMALNFVPMDWGLSLAELRRFIAGFGLRAELVFALLTAGLMLLGSPRLIFYGLGGLLFGFWMGLAAALAGSLLGSVVMFRIVRWGGRRWARERFVDYRLLQRVSRMHLDAMAVIMVRQLPISNVLINAGLALSRVKSRDFLLGTLVGFLPQGAVVCLLGSGAGHRFTQEGAKGWAQLASALALAVLFSLWAYRRRTRPTASPQ